MVKVYCDYCKKTIETANEQVNLDTNAYGCTGVPKQEFQFHVECYTRVINHIKAFLSEKAADP